MTSYAIVSRTQFSCIVGIKWPTTHATDTIQQAKFVTNVPKQLKGMQKEVIGR